MSLGVRQCPCGSDTLVRQVVEHRAGLVAQPRTPGLCLEPTSMHRLIAKLLLAVFALRVFAPLLQAFSAEPPHACCLRRLHSRNDRSLQFSDAKRPGGNCCPPLTTPQSANVAAHNTAVFCLKTSAINRRSQASHYAAFFKISDSPRAPPSSFLA